MKENNGTHTFDTGSDNTPENGKKSPAPLKKYLLYAILAVAAIIVILLGATVITEIVQSVKDSKLPDDGNGDGKVEMVNGDIKFESSALTSAEVKKGDLLIINKTYNIDPTVKAAIAAAAQNAYLTSGGSTYYKFERTDDKVKLSPEIITAFKSLAEGLSADTQCNDLLFCYGILDPKEKTLEYDYSHQLGTVIDVKLSTSGQTKTIQNNKTVEEWLNTKACNYGFVVEYAPTIYDDNTHVGHGSDEAIPSTQIRYVGVPHATYMQVNSLTFDAYMSKLKAETSAAKPLTFKAGNSSYAVYYVPASGESFEAQLPTNYNYSLSGNNVDGVIVTVELSVAK